MKRIELSQVADSSEQLKARMSQEVGSLVMPQSIEVATPDKVFLDSLATTQDPRMPGATLIPLAQNVQRLTQPDAVGKGFGVLLGDGRVYAGVINDRTQAGQLRFTYLASDPLNPKNLRDLTDFQRLMLQAGTTLQGTEVGVDSADKAKGTAAELGHAYFGLRAITDTNVMSALQRGNHLVHDWASSTGVATAVTKAGPASSGMLDVVTEAGTRHIEFRDLELAGRERAVLIDHPAFHGIERPVVDGTTPAEAALGVGILAAQTQLGQEGRQFEDRVMRAMAAV